MGKVKSRRSKGKGRVQPTGLPSVKEAERQQALEAAEPEGMDGMPLLDKVTTGLVSFPVYTSRFNLLLGTRLLQDTHHIKFYCRIKTLM